VVDSLHQLSSEVGNWIFYFSSDKRINYRWIFQLWVLFIFPDNRGEYTVFPVMIKVKVIRTLVQKVVAWCSFPFLWP